MSLRHHLSVVLTAVCALALLAAPAHGADPLLSGYGGPGSGEQALLGGGTVGGGGGPSGSAASPSAAGQSLRAATPATAATGTSNASSDTAATVTRKPSRKKSPSSSSEQAMKGSTTSTGSTSTAPSSSSATSPGAPRVVAYPTRAGDAGALPLSFAQALLVVLGAGVLALAILGLRRLAGGAEDPPSSPQASVR
jgi:hypothetical protein